MRKSFVITFAREGSDRGFRLRVRSRILIVAAVSLAASPIMFLTAASWGTRVLLVNLLRQNEALQVENGNYREATTQLASQVSVLQAAADELKASAAFDPQAARAMDRLPASITHRAMGGSALGDVAEPVANVVAATDPAFGLLRDVLHIIEAQLDRVRSGAERRQALAAATPSIWPVTGGLSSTFGNRRDPFTGYSEFHAGLDITADSGQPVRATADGTVTTARFNGNFGNMVMLDHGFGIATRYAHLSRFAVSEGTQVRKGAIVGFVGSTGRSTSPHVHYELLLNGRPANPLRLLGR